MNNYITHTGLAMASVVLIAGCGGATGTDETRSDSRDQTQAVAGGTYDGWAVRARYERPPTCWWSPDQIQRMLDAGQPLPACVRRLQHWFEKTYVPVR